MSYRSAHHRVWRSRGRASEHVCACGEPARNWAYDHRDPNPLFDERERAYSNDPSRYVAMCVPCHSRFDAAYDWSGLSDGAYDHGWGLR